MRSSRYWGTCEMGTPTYTRTYTRTHTHTHTHTLGRQAGSTSRVTVQQQAAYKLYTCSQASHVLDKHTKRTTRKCAIQTAKQGACVNSQVLVIAYVPLVLAVQTANRLFGTHPPR